MAGRILRSNVLRMSNFTLSRFPAFLIAIVLLITSCAPKDGNATPAPEGSPAVTPTIYAATPYPTRLEYLPGELVDYTAQTGDTLPALAARFNTTVDEILSANPEIPLDATTMPPGMPMKIPIYYLPLWGNPYQILPDSLYVNGPSAVGFDTAAFVASRPGWLKDYREFSGDRYRTGAEIVDRVAQYYSISPRFLLALLEYQLGALSLPEKPAGRYPLGYEDFNYPGVYLQLIWAADLLNTGYYRWRTARLTEFEHLDGRLERPDPWQNAATVAFQYYFSRLHDRSEYDLAIGPDGLAGTYRKLFGDPWLADVPHIPVSLQQPALLFPFPAGETWGYSGGPHTGWGRGDPLAALDFGPPSENTSCMPSPKWATAMADGLVIRAEPENAIVVIDMDMDGDARTGWVLFYLHVGNEGMIAQGTTVQAGDRIGHPSCEGGRATGAHVHIARLYNGEWMPAEGPLGFNLEGWIAYNGDGQYQGTLVRNNVVVIANEQGKDISRVTAGR